MLALNRRAALINQALFWAVASALVTILLMIVAFADAFLNLPHERGVALMFAVALILFGVSLVNFGREIRIAIRDPNNYD
jgi:heme A synthase